MRLTLPRLYPLRPHHAAPKKGRRSVSVSKVVASPESWLGVRVRVRLRVRLALRVRVRVRVRARVRVRVQVRVRVRVS